MRVPHTYAEWAEVLDAFQNKMNDGDTLRAMQQGTLEWQAGVAERFVKRLMDAIIARLNSASDRFQKEIGRARGQESLLTQAILALRKELIFLHQAANLPALPEKERKFSVEFVKEQADKFQASLKQSARSDRSGKLSSIIRNNRVNNF